VWAADSAVRDADAFAEIVSRYSAMVYGTCKRVTRNPTDAEDVAQECFIELARVRRTITPSLGGWLHRVAVRRSLNRLKAESRRKRREVWKLHSRGFDRHGDPPPRHGDLDYNFMNAIRPTQNGLLRLGGERFNKDEL